MAALHQTYFEGPGGVGDVSFGLPEDSRLQKKLEGGHGTICDALPAFLGFAVGGWSYSIFLASEVWRRQMPARLLSVAP